ncbi:MAG: HipA domain-containing protein [Bacteroidales bacterium]|nr:HipA domain-containing protein [Bacteroidales bacterium]
MKKNNCLYCYKEISTEDLKSDAGKEGFHPACSRKFFGKPIPPELPYTEDEMLKLAEQVIKSHKTVTGVQPKLSLGIQKMKNSQRPERFTIVGLWGEYILKPQTNVYRSLPELEDLTMHLAQISRIKTMEHSLMKLKSGQLVYITKRADRYRSEKFHMEDMCQLTERLTEHKYNGSYEQIAKAILKYSTNPVFDAINFYELVVFSFLTGNNDMHLKNFSLLKNKQRQYNLSPAYDLIASALVVEGDDEELALTLNGKKKKITRKDFETAMKRAGIDDKAMENIFNKFMKTIPLWHEMIDISFVPDDLKNSYHEMVERKLAQISIT